MKLIRMLAAAMVVCLLGCAFAACGGGTSGTETGTPEGTEPPAVDIQVSLVIKDGTTQKYSGSVHYTGKQPTLENLIGLFCAEQDFEEDAFDENGLLSVIGELKAGDGRSFIAYYEDEGESKKFESIKKQTIADGKTVVIVLK